MTVFRSLVVSLFLAFPVTVFAADPPDGMELVWSDEFEGKSLDWSKWSIEQNAFGGGNNELQIYTDRTENVRVEDGRLVVEARRDNAAVQGTSREYSSGRLRTKHRGDWTYGYVEVRARLPRGKGVWPAIWMLPTDERYGGWAASGEIDIVELKGSKPNVIHGTLHHGDAWPRNVFTTKTHELPEGTFADDFHTFAVHWREGRVDWLLDGKVWQAQTKWSTPGGEFPAPFDQPFHLVLNVAIGGRYDGAPDATTTFPLRMEVDHVRVYQAK